MVIEPQKEHFACELLELLLVASVVSACGFSRSCSVQSHIYVKSYVVSTGDTNPANPNRDSRPELLSRSRRRFRRKSEHTLRYVQIWMSKYSPSVCRIPTRKRSTVSTRHTQRWKPEPSDFSKIALCEMLRCSSTGTVLRRSCA
jgi:hypothetical protein